MESIQAKLEEISIKQMIDSPTSSQILESPSTSQTLLSPTASQILENPGRSVGISRPKRSGSSSTSSQHRTVNFSPSLGSGHKSSETLSITCSKREVRTSAVSFQHSALIHTQLESRTIQNEPSVILVRITDIDPSAPTLPPTSVSRALWNALFCYFSSGMDAPESYHIEFPLPSLVLHSALISIGGIQKSPHYTLTRSAIFQLFAYAYSDSITLPFPYTSTKTLEISHPVRAPKPNSSNPCYSRIIPHLDYLQYFQISICILNDLTTLHNWLNDPRVDEFWQEKGTWEEHEKFLEERRIDPHVLPVIGSYVISKEGEGNLEKATSSRAMYSEIYWVKEDRLGTYLGADKVDDYDRGLHVLVGSTIHRGPHRVRAWLPSLVHYCFLDDARTNRVYAEPNQLNKKMIAYFESVGFVRHGDVVFPHKTAALMICERNAFYDKCPF